jgi:hypothetical protein
MRLGGDGLNGVTLIKGRIRSGRLLLLSDPVAGHGVIAFRTEKNLNSAQGASLVGGDEMPVQRKGRTRPTIPFSNRHADRRDWIGDTSLARVAP